jgi:hypothetical protein
MHAHVMLEYHQFQIQMKLLFHVFILNKILYDQLGRPHGEL